MLNYKKAPYLELEDYHAPAGIQSYFIPMKDGVKIRLCFWQSSSDDKKTNGTILLQQGHNEFVEKYYEVIDEFISRGFSVICFDWRGQGLSEKTLKDKNKAYIKDFSKHDEDLEFIINKIIQPHFSKPFFGIGHSMGGCLLLSFLNQHPNIFKSVILSAPMLGFKKEGFLLFLVSILNLFGKDESYLVGSQPNMGIETPFNENDLTSDQFRYERTLRLIRKSPNIRLWGITVAWANAAKKRLEIIRKKGWAEKIKTNILIINCLEDRVVDSKKISTLSNRLPNCSVIEFSSTEHEIFMEKDVYRKRLWKEIDNHLNKFIKN